MTAADRHARATALFLDTADLAPEAREEILSREPDTEVLASVRALLAGHESPSGPLDEPAVTPLIKRPLADARVIGREVGPWRITGRLGQGGMGAVYRAERADGLYDREVALKLLAPDADLASGWLAQRLDAERRILARLEHPGIARLYDGGITDDGLPYLAMELVHGESITAHADARGLSTRDRVALVAEVCDAVAYAHRLLVVHRDLKPSNILVASGEAGTGGRGTGDWGSGKREARDENSPPPVQEGLGVVDQTSTQARSGTTPPAATGETLRPLAAHPPPPAGAGTSPRGGVNAASGARSERDARGDSASPHSLESSPPRAARVKLLDFGVSSLLEEGESFVTQRRALTPAYAAPEQVRGETITTATDVYALGVVLYELLTRQRPYRLSGTTAAEAERIVCEHTPGTPSVTAPEAISKELRGDLDAIVMRALEKEPARRYPSAQAFADDLRRHLDGEPVEARPATATYRAGRFVRRHRTAVAAAAVAVVALLAGSGVAIWQAMEASHARDRAEERFGIAQEAARAMLYDVHDAIAGLPGSTPARETIVARSLDYLDRLASGADDDPVLRLDLAGAYFRIANVQGNPTDNNLGRPNDAIASYRHGLSMLPPLASLPDSLVSRSLIIEGQLHEKLGVTIAHSVSPEAALEHIDRALATHRRNVARAPGNAEAITYLATSHINRADYSGHPYFPNIGQPDSAMAHYERARGLLESIPERDETLFSLRMLGITYEREGNLLREQRDLDGAIAPTRRALELRERIAARDDATAGAQRDVGVSYEALGRLYLDGGQTAQAVRELQRAFGVYEGLLRADPESSHAQQTAAFGHLHLGRALVQAGRRSEARRHLDASVRLLTVLANQEPGSTRAQGLVEEAREARATAG